MNKEMTHEFNEMDERLEALSEEIEQLNDKFDALSSCLNRDLKEFKEDHIRRIEMRER